MWERMGYKVYEYFIKFRFQGNTTTNHDLLNLYTHEPTVIVVKPTCTICLNMKGFMFNLSLRRFYVKH